MDLPLDSRLSLGVQTLHRRTEPAAGPWLPTIDEMADLVGLVDRCGYDSMWVGDHVSFTIAIFDPLLQLAQAAVVSRRLVFGTGVYLLPLRHPTPVAKQVSTLDHLTEGRFIFGVGVGGEFPREYEACGVPLGERGARLSESIAVLRKLWSGQPASHDGRFFKFENIPMQPPPRQPGGPPIWAGGRSDAALRRTGRMTDGWMSYVVTPDMFRQGLDKIAAAAAQANRVFERGFGTSHLLFTRLDETYEKALDAATVSLSQRYAMDFRKAAQRYCALGTPQQVAETVLRFHEAGARHIVLDFVGPYEDRDRQIERFAAEAMPLLAALREREMTMRLGMLLRYHGDGLALAEVLEAERLGYHSVWSGEAYGTDAVTPTAWILARTTKIKAGTGIMQMQARTPACTAMTALTLQALSNNRFLLGIGASGPQVVEGWHGVAFGKPMARTREYIEILRKILRREAALQHRGEIYQIPYTGPGATGLGKPLKSILHGNPDMPIYAASITPVGLRTAGEVADGVLPIFMSPEKTRMVIEPLRAGLARGRPGRTLADFDVAPYVRIAMGPDLQACRDALKPELALYIGGMGARTKNFYNDFTRQLGYEEAAVRIQDAFLGGRRTEAIAAVPDSLVDEVSLVGSRDRIKDRLQAWKAAGKTHEVGSMLLSGVTVDSLRVAAEAVL